MIHLHLKRDEVVHFLRCLADGVSIDHQGGWTRDQMLSLAGACFFGALSQGPAKYLHDQDVLKQLDPEHHEAVGDQLHTDLLLAIEFGMFMADLVRNDGYDEDHEPELEVILSERDGKKVMQPVRGFRAL